MAGATFCGGRRGWIAAFLLFGATPPLPGQAQPQPRPASNSGPVASYSNLIFTVSNLEASVAFYRDLIGLEALSVRRGSPGDTIVGPYVAKVSGSPAGVVFSSAILRLPGAGFNLLLTEFGNVDRTHREANPRDVGATVLVLIVRDLDPLYNALKKRSARIVTRGGAPVDLPDHSRSVVIRDVDGFLVQLLQPAHAADSAGPENILSARLRLTVRRLDDIMAFYGSVLGFQLSPAVRVSDPFAQRLMDMPRAAWRRSTGGLPGAGESFEFIQYGRRREAASPFERLRDPGTPAFSLGVRNIDALLTAIKANGSPIVSEGGQPAASPNGGRNVFIRDPSGFFLELEGPSER